MTEGNSCSKSNFSNQSVGQDGEEMAEQYLRKKGYRLLERQYRTSWGELDLIMEDGRTLVFVEVKHRRNLRYGMPEEAVTLWKMKHIIRSAVAYLGKKGFTNRMSRFDVVSIGPDFIRHYPDAFLAGDEFYF